MGQAKQKDLRIQELQEENRNLKATLALMGGEGVLWGESKATSLPGVLVRDITIKVPIPAGWSVPQHAQPHYDKYSGTVSIRLQN